MFAVDSNSLQQFYKSLCKGEIAKMPRPEHVNGLDFAYLFPIYDREPGLIDVPAFLRASGEDLYHNGLLPALTLEMAVNDPMFKVRLINFYYRLNPYELYEDRDAATLSKIMALRRRRAEVVSQFFLDPLDMPEEFFVCSPPTGVRLWESKCVNPRERYRIAAGEPTIIPKKHFNTKTFERLCNFTEGVFTPESIRGFPWSNAVIAGGSVPQILSASGQFYASSDLDIFTFGRTDKEKENAKRNIVQWFAEQGKKLGLTVYYVVLGGVLTIVFKGIERKFQLINDKEHSPQAIVERFDLSSIQWFMYYSDGQLRFRGTPSAISTARTRVACVNNPERFRMPRVLKTLFYGYDIEYDSRVQNTIFDIDSLLKPENSAEIEKSLRECFTNVTLPTSRADDDPYEVRQRDFHALEKATKGGFPTLDVDEAIGKTRINVHFNLNYDSIFYGSFNPNVLRGARNRHRRWFRETVSDSHGPLNFLSGDAEIIEINTEDDIIIKVRIIDENFALFVRDFEGRYAVTYIGREVNRKALTMDNRLTLIIPQYVAGRREQRGESIVKSPTGCNIALAEGLKLGDRVHFVFTMEYKVENQNSELRFQGRSIIKNNAEVEEEIHNEILPRKITPDIADGPKYEELGY